jgi:hypothetical protein
MYSTLILALPEDDLSIIENVSEDDTTCGQTAWTAFVDHYEDDGIYRCTELLQNLETPQADGESGIQYLNRLVRLQRQLARVKDVVHDRRIIMYLVKGLRSDYHSITNTWDVHKLGKRDLRQKSMRIVSRAQSHTTEPPMPTAFAACHDDATTDLLKRQVSELQDQLKSLQGAATTRRASYGRGAARVFRGVCYGCGKKGHRISECPYNNTGGNFAQVDSPVAFPAVMDVTATPARPFSEARHMFKRDGETWMWFTDSGASHHMTSVRRDFCEYRALTNRLWVKGIIARVVGVGSVRIIFRKMRGDLCHAEECAPHP